MWSCADRENTTAQACRLSRVCEGRHIKAPSPQKPALRALLSPCERASGVTTPQKGFYAAYVDARGAYGALCRQLCVQW